MKPQEIVRATWNKFNSFSLAQKRAVASSLGLITLTACTQETVTGVVLSIAIILGAAALGDILNLRKPRKPKDSSAPRSGGLSGSK